MPLIPAPEVERILWQRLTSAFSDPAEFAVVLERAITELRSREADLSQEIAPLRSQLREVDTELERIELAWVRGRVRPEKLEALERRIEAIDPGSVEELEMTQARVRVAQEYLDSARERNSTDFQHLVKTVLWDGQPVEIPEGRRQLH
jgi:prefoldin subunit 5